MNHISDMKSHRLMYYKIQNLKFILGYKSVDKKNVSKEKDYDNYAKIESVN